MQFFRKFYDVAAAEVPNIATIMAKSGALNHPDSGATIPQISTEKKEETQQPPASANAATAQEAPKADGTTESPTPKEEIKTELPKQEEPPKSLSWQEVLKQQQPDIVTLLKEAGFDDDTASFLKGKKGIDKKLLNFLTHWEQNGDVNRYLQEASTDYNKMSAEDIMRMQLRREYPKATEKQLDILFKKEILENYRLIPEVNTEAEMDEGRELLSAKAEKYRDQFIKEQQEYVIPKPPDKKDEDEADLAQSRQLYDSFKNTFDNNAALRELTTNKTYIIGEGEDVFNLPLSNPKEAVEEMLDLLATHIAVGRITKDDLPKINDDYIKNRILINEFARNPQAFIKKIGDHFITIGGRKVIAPIENAKAPDGTTPAKAEGQLASPAAAMAKSGKIVSGGN